MQRISVGDQVIVIAGNDKGKRGKVTRVLKERQAVLIEGVNQVKRHMKATPQRGGGILEIEARVSLSKVMPVRANTGFAIGPTGRRSRKRSGCSRVASLAVMRTSSMA